MKRIRIIELFANIKANLVSFFSISMFVALGLGLFCGVQWGATAITNALQQNMEKGNLYDLEISFPYGMTQENIDEIKKVEGVSKVEVAYSSFAYMVDGNKSYVLKLSSMTDTINQPTAVLGTMPVEKNEAAVLRSFAEKKSIRVGDTIKLKHDSGDSNDTDGMKALLSDSFVVTALVDNPAFISNEPNSFGVSGLGAGTIDGVAWITSSAFDSKFFNDAYPNAFVGCDSLKGINTLSTQYAEAVAPIKSSLVDLGKKLGKARYEKLHADAQQKIDD
ncbi:MAG: hypothetical protein Q4B54_05500, partial [Coriobacteriales bacterium]|nr:hypothetical protein [Coriobacteriales bacterium]